MPSASSAKSAKASSVPPAEPRPSTATLTKSAAPVTGSPIVTNSNVDPSSIVSSVSNAVTGGVGAGVTAATASIAVAPAVGAAAPATTTSLTAENNSSSSSLSTPIKQTLVVIEHKIRNLEKRKTKLESYRAIQASGKELSADQKQAVAKYDEVMQCLDFARDLTKQMIQLSNNAEKEQKKLARREAMLRAQAETVKIREVLTIQNILLQFGDATVREDFLNGTNGAAKIDEEDLNNLEKFYFDVTAKRQESPEDVPFLVSAQKAAELFSFTIDGRPKQYGDTTFENLRKVFQTIQECGYLDLAGKAETTEEEELVEMEATEQAQDEESIGNDLNAGATEQEGRMELFTGEVIQLDMTQAQPVVTLVEVPQYEAPSAAAVPAPAFPQPAPLLQQQTAVLPATLLGPGQMAPPQSQLPRQVIVPSVVPATATVVGGLVAQPPPQAGQVPLPGVPPAGAAGQIHASHFPPTTVRAVEQGYFKQHQYIQQMRPLADVIGSTNFHFLQESELDSPDMVPPGGFTPTDGQTANPVMGTAVIPLQSPNTIPQPLIQQQPPQQQQQQPAPQQTPMPLQQPAGIPQQSQAGAPNSGIPTQTFTNQAFPPIVPPQAAGIFPATVIQNPDLSVTQQPPQPQMPPVIFSSPQQPGGPGVIPMQSLVAPPVVVSQQQTPQSQILGGIVDNQTVVDVISQQAAANIANLMTGPRVNVSLPGYAPNKFPQQPPNAAMVGAHPASVSQIPVQDARDSLQQQTQQPANDKKQHHDELKENRGPPQQNDTSQDWDAHEPHVQQKSHTQALAARQDEESNQWSNEVTSNSNSSSKHDWNSNYDNQNDSNTWKSISNDNYGGRGTSGGRNSYANRTGGVGRGGSGMRGNNAGGGGSGGGPPSNGYRGRSNNYQQQQNNRNAGMYFRNNDSYYQNQNGNSGGYGNKDSSGNYVGGSNSNYRPRGGPVPPNSRQQSGGRLGGPPNGGGGPGPQGQSGRSNAAGSGGQNPNRSSNMGGTGGGNMSTNPNSRPGRNNPGSAYGNSRPPPPPNSVRQQQDINA